MSAHRQRPVLPSLRLAAALSLVAVASLTPPVTAQTVRGSDPTLRPRYAVGLVAGASQFDLSGTGTAGLIGARFDAELRRWLIAEGALGVFRPEEQFGGRTLYAIPEVQLQVQLPGRVVRPYVGAGGGYVVASGGRGTCGTASGAAGLRVALPGAPFEARGELRVRGIGRSFTGSTAEWTLGVGRRF